MPDNYTPLVLHPGDPLPSARAMVEMLFQRHGKRTIQAHATQLYTWSGPCYAALDDAAARAATYAFLEQAKRPGKDDTMVPFAPNTAKVSNVIDALHAVANVPLSLKLPAWLEDSDKNPVASEILACRNGLLDLPTRRLLPLTPTFFNLNAVEFDFNPTAPAPKAWLAFLASIWPGDAEAIGTLQELFGYLLTTDTRQQKIFLLVGPKRSGKGTIARVCTALLGQDNVAGPTLAGLGQQFGLEPLIGKQAAIIADARLSSRTDQAAIAERLLSISGEDSLTVDRKFKMGWTGRLGVRFLMLTNELPQLTDASGALSSRFIILTMTNSFFGHEDHGLTDRLLAELPSILNWAIAGWDRLRARGYFAQPASSAQAVEELETLGSPVTAFIRERCVIGSGCGVSTDRMYEAWVQWCKDNGRDQPGTKQTFGRNLNSAVPGLKTRQYREEDYRGRRFEGINLR